MHIITRGKTARSHADIQPGCPLHDAVYQDHSEKKVQSGGTFECLLTKLADKANRIHEQHHLPEDSPVIIIIDLVASHCQEALTPIAGHLHQCKDHSSQYICFRRKRRSQISNPPDQLINSSMRRFVSLSLRDRMVKQGMRIHNKEIPSRTPLDMSERAMKSLLVQWVSSWCKETRTAQQIVTSWEMVLREVPIADSVDAMPELPRVILLGPPEQDAPAIAFNQHVIEPADEAGDHEPEPAAPAAPELPAAPQRAPLAPLPSRSKRLARQAADCQVRAAQRNALLQDSDDSDSDPFAQLSADVDFSYSES